MNTQTASRRAVRQSVSRFQARQSQPSLRYVPLSSVSHSRPKPVRVRHALMLVSFALGVSDDVAVCALAVHDAYVVARE